MLKKAGIVVLGAAAGMLSLAPLASAGEASHGGHDDDRGHHGEHDRDHGHRGGGDCGDFALSQGDSLVNASNLLANADVEDIAILGSNSGDDDDCGGGRGDGRDGHGHGGHGHGGHGHGGHRGGDSDTAISQGDSLINASNLLANADVSDIAVLGSNS